MKNGNRGIVSHSFRGMFIVQIMAMLIGIIGSVVDGMITGSFLGEEAMAAFGFTSCVTLAVAIAGSIFSTGTSLLCSKSIGEGKRTETRHVFSVCFTGTLILTAVLTAAIIALAAPVAALAGAKGGVASDAADYIRGYGIACPGIVLVAFLMPALQMDGEMNRILLAALVMTVGDIAADLLNVLVFRGGMFGMAMATAVSSWLALLVLLPHFARKQVIFTRPSLKLDRGILRDMMVRGFPNAASQIGRLLLAFVLNRFLFGLGGDPAVAAHAVILSAGNLCMVPGSALSACTEVLTGELFGEEDRGGLVDMMRTAMRYNLVVNGAVMLVFFAAAGPIVGLFYRGDAALLGTTVTGLRFYTLCMVFYGINLIFRSSLQGTGQTRAAYTMTIIDVFVGPLACALLLGTCFGVPVFWLCNAISEALVAAAMMLLFRRRNPGRKGMEAFFLFPKDFCLELEDTLEISMDQNSLSQAVCASEKTVAFGEKLGADRRTASLMGLAVEEAVTNILEHGTADGKQHRIELRVLKKTDGWVIRIRDDCPLFDPDSYLKQFSGEDPAANIGLKLLYGMAEEITYLNTLKLNNLIIRIRQQSANENGTRLS